MVALDLGVCLLVATLYTTPSATANSTLLFIFVLQLLPPVTRPQLDVQLGFVFYKVQIKIGECANK